MRFPHFQRAVSEIALGVGQIRMREIKISNAFANFAEFNLDINYVSLQSFESEIKARLLIQKYVRDHGLTPYKLSLMADVSTSHTHGALTRDWSPSPKIARRLANSIPADFAIEFDLYWSNFMPRFVTVNDENPELNNHSIKIKDVSLNNETDIINYIREFGGYFNVHQIKNQKITLQKSFASLNFPYPLEEPILPRFFYPFVLMDINKQKHENVIFQSPFVLTNPDHPFVMKWTQYNIFIDSMLYAMYFPIKFTDIPKELMWIPLEFYRSLNKYTALSFSGDHPYFSKITDYMEPNPIEPARCA